MKTSMLQKAALITGIGVGVSLSAALIRSLLCKRHDVSNILEPNSNDLVELKLEVPRKLLGFVIGKRGLTIRRLREESGATIRVSDQTDEMALVIVRGHRENAELAMNEVKKLIQVTPRIFTKEIILNGNTWQAVVGVNGDDVRQISSESKAAVTVKWLDAHNSDVKSNNCKYAVTVKGSREQIDCALQLIDERVAQASIMQNNKTVGLVGRALLDNVIPSMPGTVTSAVFPTSVDGFTEVFVSAVQSPSHFWVQLCGPQSTELDKLTSEMTEFYRKEASEQFSAFQIHSVVPGDLVAAYYDGDKDWYRALVLSVEKLANERMSATVLFVDFGDSAVVELSLLLKLKPEYLAIPLQAIKCSLYGVLPFDNEQWTQEAIQMFESITYLAQWKPIMAKPVFHNENHATSDINDCKTVCNDAHDIVPVVLIDTNNAQDIDIAKQLVDSKHAVEVNHMSKQKC